MRCSPRQRHGKILNSSTTAPCPQDTAHFSCTGTMSSEKELQTAGTTPAQPGVKKRHVEMDARGRDVGPLELPPRRPHNSKGSHRSELLPEKRCTPCQAPPTPGQASQRRASLCLQKPLGLASKGPEGWRGLHFLSKDLLWSQLLRDSAQRHPSKWKAEHSFANLSASAGGVWRTDESLPGDRGTEGRHYWTPAYL